MPGDVPVRLDGAVGREDLVPRALQAPGVEMDGMECFWVGDGQGRRALVGRVSVISALRSALALLTYSDNVAIFFVKLVQLKKLLMSPGYHSGDVEIRYARQVRTREPLKAMESDAVDHHTEVYAKYQAPEEVA